MAIDPQVLAALIGAGTSIGGGILAGMGKDKEQQYLAEREDKQTAREDNRYADQLALEKLIREIAERNSYINQLGQDYRYEQDRDAKGAQAVANRNDYGKIPGTYASLALKRALWEGTPDGATSTNLVQVTPPGDIADSMGSISGGIALGPAKAAMQKYLSDAVLANDLSYNQGLNARLDPKTPTFDMTSMFGTSANPLMQQVAGLKAQTLQDRQADRSAYEGQRDSQHNAVMSALQGTGAQTAAKRIAELNARTMQDQQLAKAQGGGSSWWKKVLPIAGSIALGVATGGMSIPAQIALQAAYGAGTGAMTGGKRGALTGAAMGAGTGALGGYSPLGRAVRGAAPTARTGLSPQMSAWIQGVR